jgi:hypothetical protein
MEMEKGQTLILSWLRDIKACQIVQTNWKASSKWEFKNVGIIENLKNRSQVFFKQKYGYDLYGDLRTTEQLMNQVEIDVLGIRIEEKQSHIYSVYVAFREGSLNSGTRDETVSRVINKFLSTAMCIYGYFGCRTGTIIFASPEINGDVERKLLICADDIRFILVEAGLNYDIRIIGNQDFTKKIFEPVAGIAGDVAHNAESAVPPAQADHNVTHEPPNQPLSDRSDLTERIVPELTADELQRVKSLEGMLIGIIARTVLRKMLEEGKATVEEIEKYQTKECSKETFDLQYPLLLKVSVNHGKALFRYYPEPLKINGEKYYLCSEWFELPFNNDRPYLMKWLAVHGYGPDNN